MDMMILREEAAAVIDRETPAVVLPREKVPVRQALGRWLAQDALSRLDLPPFDKSAMDGFAVRADDQRESYRVLETVAAGRVPTVALTPGGASKVMTGAPVPAGTGRVIKVEDVREEGGSIRLLHDAPERNLCRKGEDIKRGDLVLRAGTRLSPVDIANLIGCGATEAEVLRPVRTAILSTGDELVDDPAQAGPGRIMNTNGPMLRLLAEQNGLEVVSESAVGDDPGKTLEALRRALEAADLVLVSGGVSAGDFDFVEEALPKAGLKVHFTQVAVKPGKPTVFATGPGKAVFGLPGNPVAVFTTFHLFALRAAARLRGQPPRAPRELALRLGFDYRRRNPERAELVPCRIQPDGSLARLAFHGSAHLAALSQADGFFLVPQGTTELPAGSAVRCLPLSLS